MALYSSSTTSAGLPGIFGALYPHCRAAYVWLLRFGHEHDLLLLTGDYLYTEASSICYKSLGATFAVGTPPIEQHESQEQKHEQQPQVLVRARTQHVNYVSVYLNLLHLGQPQ
jgi:hypothetical protein